MDQPYSRIFNFSAGPCTLPVPVLESARDGLLNYNGVGMGVMEMSHRSETFEAILASTEADFRSLLNIPENYKVLFMQGGASTQFATIPMNFLKSGQTAEYIVTGEWGKKAAAAAKLVGETNVVWDGKSNNYNQAPDLESLPLSDSAAYVHFTSNETIQGVQIKGDPTLAAPVVCDMSSDILSRPVDISKYALIYAGAQKNMGPAGVTVVIIREDFMADRADGLQPIFDYRVIAENGSMYNTPPCWSIYMCGLVYKYMFENGGVEAARSKCDERSSILYKAIDQSEGFYTGHAVAANRSTMNVTFNLPTEDLAKEFVKEALGVGLDGLKGHRSVGGIRASIYNAFPVEGCETMASFMGGFAARNG